MSCIVKMKVQISFQFEGAKFFPFTFNLKLSVETVNKCECAKICPFSEGEGEDANFFPFTGVPILFILFCLRR